MPSSAVCRHPPPGACPDSGQKAKIRPCRSTQPTHQPRPGHGAFHQPVFPCNVQPGPRSRRVMSRTAAWAAAGKGRGSPPPGGREAHLLHGADLERAIEPKAVHLGADVPIAVVGAGHLLPHGRQASPRGPVPDRWALDNRMASRRLMSRAWMKGGIPRYGNTSSGPATAPTVRPIRLLGILNVEAGTNRWLARVSSWPR